MYKRHWHGLIDFLVPFKTTKYLQRNRGIKKTGGGGGVANFGEKGAFRLEVGTVQRRM